MMALFTTNSTILDLVKITLRITTLKKSLHACRHVGMLACRHFSGLEMYDMDGGRCRHVGILGQKF